MTDDAYGEGALAVVAAHLAHARFHHGLTSVPLTIAAGQRVSFSVTLPSQRSIGGNSRTVTMSNILANDNARPVDITLTETTAPSGRSAKAPKGVFLEDVSANPIQADYDGESTISWHGASGSGSGSVIGIDYDRVTINHVKDHPGAALPAKGPYQIEDIKAPATLAVIADNTTGVGPQRLTRSVTLLVAATRTSGATGDTTVITAGAGQVTVPIALLTVFTIAAQNPVFPQPPANINAMARPIGDPQQATSLQVRLISSTDYQNGTAPPTQPWAKTMLTRPAMASRDMGQILAMWRMDTSENWAQDTTIPNATLGTSARWVARWLRPMVGRFLPTLKRIKPSLGYGYATPEPHI